MIDYQETFIQVAKMNMVRVLLLLAANFNWQLQQFDVKNISLQGELADKIYMKILSGLPRVWRQIKCKSYKKHSMGSYNP